MDKLNFNYDGVLPFVETEEIYNMEELVLKAHNELHNRTGLGNEYIGWLDWPANYNKEEYNRIKVCASKINDDSDVFVVIGIGGSYLGARAAIEMLNSSFVNFSNDRPLIIYAGNSLNSTYLTDLMEFIKDKEVSVNVISKSGTTIESAIAFRFLKSFLEDKYGKEEAKKRIYVTTDSTKGALRNLAITEGYEVFTVPDNIGGRYSILTSVGLLPMAVSGIDIDKVMKGACDALKDFSVFSIKDNYCYQYAVIRNILYNKGKAIEILTNYESNMYYFNEWWKQLFGESEGKNRKGIFPASMTFSTDLHSLGQYIQDGGRNIFETVIKVNKPTKDITFKEDTKNIDGLNFLMGKTMDFINSKAFEGTSLAHINGGVPNLVINIPAIEEYNFGYLVYFFEKACAISGYILGVNPFDQPGVEEYKKNMFALLGKPGYEALKKELEIKLQNKSTN